MRDLRGRTLLGKFAANGLLRTRLPFAVLLALLVRPLSLPFVLACLSLTSYGYVAVGSGGRTDQNRSTYHYVAAAIVIICAFCLATSSAHSFLISTLDLLFRLRQRSKQCLLALLLHDRLARLVRVLYAAGLGIYVR